MSQVEPTIGCYLLSLFAYRALYIFNWIYRYYTESYYDQIAIFAGILQTILYFDFITNQSISTLFGSKKDEKSELSCNAAVLKKLSNSDAIFISKTNKNE